MKRSTGLGRSSRLGVLLTATALLAAPALAGCTAVSPIVTKKPYAASDGSNGTLTDTSGAAVDLRNFLVVGTEKGGKGALVGSVVNQGKTPVTVSLTVMNAAGDSSIGTGSITAKPGEVTQVGVDGNSVSVTAVDPGTVLKLKADAGAGSAMLSLPVLSADGPYKSLAP